MQTEWTRDLSRRTFLGTSALSLLATANTAFHASVKPSPLVAAQALEPPNGKLSGKLAYQLAHCVTAAYETNAFANYASWKEANATIVGDFASDQKDIRGFVANSGDWVIVTFRGTVITDKRNWKADLDQPVVPMAEGSEIQVHGGFLKAYLSVKTALEKAIPSDRGTKRLLYCGHSLGGGTRRPRRKRPPSSGPANQRCHFWSAFHWKRAFYESVSWKTVPICERSRHRSLAARNSSLQILSESNLDRRREENLTSGQNQRANSGIGKGSSRSPFGREKSRRTCQR